MKSYTKFLILVVVAGLSLSASGQTIDITETAVDEKDLNGAVLNLTLTDCIFSPSIGILDETLVVLNNAPSGLSVSVFDATSTTTAEVTLAFTPGDFDDTISNFHLGIPASMLSPAVLVNTDVVELTGNIESAAITEVLPDPMDEHDLDETSYIIITLTNELFVAEASLVPGDFTLVNFPSGLTITGIKQTANATDDTHAYLELDFTPGDFDADSANCTVSIAAGELTYSSSALETSPAITVWDSVETATFNAGSSQNLDEYTLDAGLVVIDLGGGEQAVDLGITNYELVNFPAGASIESVTSSDNVTIEIEIASTYTDIDADITNAQIKILPAALTYNKPNNLFSNTFTITATNETPVASFEALPALDEYNLDQRVLTINLTEEWFTTPGNFDVNDLTPVDFPAGLTMASATASDSATFTVTLAFPYTDFDASTDISLEINHLELAQTSGADLVTGTKTITAFDEVPVATIAGTPTLVEYELDGKELTVNLIEDWFATPGNFDATDLTPVNFPTGLTIASATASDSTTFTVTLSNVYNDIDANVDIQLDINHLELVQTSGTDLRSGTKTITAVVEVPTATIGGTPALVEYDLDGKILTVTLTDEWIADTNNFDATDLTPVNFPTGLTIVSALPIDSSSFTVTLANTYNDFDANVDIQLDINHNELVQTSVTDLRSGIKTITHVFENPAASIESLPALVEYELHGKVITVKLYEEWISDTNNFDAGDLTPINFPTGLSIVSALPVDSSEFTVTLANIYNDFDANVNIQLGINHLELVQQGVTDLVSGNKTVTAVVENPSASIDPTPALSEYNLDTKTITVRLSEEWIGTIGTFNKDDLTLVDAPAGLFISSATVLDSANFTVYLRNTYNDFDIDYDLKVSINHLELIQQSGTNLISGSTTIAHVFENPVATITPDVALAEYTLAGRVLTLGLSEEWFDEFGIIDETHFSLVNAPTGLTIESASASDSITASIILTYDTTDFDINANLILSIDHTQLIQTGGSNLESNGRTVTAYVEIPIADMTESDMLREYWLASRSLDIKFTDEKFTTSALDVNHFGLSEAPAGVSVGSLSNIADSSVTLNLAFDDTDFDVFHNNVKVAISNVVLLQTETDSLRTSAFTVHPNIEPVVDNIIFDDLKMKVGDTIDVTINLSNVSVDSIFTLGSGNIGGYQLFNLAKNTNDQYTAQFTILENQLDYYAAEDIPVNNLRLDDSPITGETFNAAHTGVNDMIDSRIPVVTTLSLITSGDKKIGDNVILLMTAIEEGLFIEDSSSINTIPVTSTDVVYSDVGGGSYTLTYTIKGNDPNVLTGDLEAKVHLRDTAGNINTVYPDILSNDLSIDATAPVISSVTNTTLADTAIVGSLVTFAIVADGPGYFLGDQSHINSTPYDELLLTDEGLGNYTVTYTVLEGDPIVVAPNLTALIELEDSAGNKSATVTTITNNDISIFTVKPTAQLTGSDVICLNDTAQLFITLTGTAPWTVKYKDNAASYFIYDIATNDYTLKISPTQSMTYQIEQVVDATGNTNTGVGTSSVTVNPLPTVSILNLNPVYAIDVPASTLEGSPVGGTFTGPGVVTAEETFTPAVAGLSGLDPHAIVYEYWDVNTCYGVDTAFVDVVEATVNWKFLDEVIDPEDIFACYLDASYRIVTKNTSGVYGQFSIPEVTNPEFLYDQGDDTLNLYPSRLDWPSGSSNRTVTIYYSYLKLGVEVTDSVDLDIEYFEPTNITSMADTIFCSNESFVPLSGNKDNLDEFSGVFSGVGTDKPPGSNYIFEPAVADIGWNTIYYTYTSPHNCVQVDSGQMLVNPTPVSDFTILDTCIFKRPVGDTIRFLNTTDTAGLGAMTWDWNFGDIASGLDNLSTEQDPKHWYSDPGFWTINLTSTTVNGCVNTYSKTFSFGDKPIAMFKWDTECYTTAPTVFSSNYTERFDSIDSYQWIISDLSGNEVLNTILPGTQLTLPHTFAAMDNYRIELKVVSELECRDNHVDTLYLRPYYQDLGAAAGYSEDFEAVAPGWIVEKSESSELQSWVYGAVDPGKFPYESVDGSAAWYTDLVRKDTIEQSWVSSPCYDFSSLDRPMVKMDIKVSSDRDRDGAALQYTTDDRKTWKNVGAIDDGSINWYNTFRILNGPGGQGEGWTGSFVFDTDPQWMTAMHDLDDLKGEPRVQFRVAYGSDGRAIEDNEGFAFDNLWIGERSRVVLLEHFTNSGDATSKDANKEINSLVGNNPLDVIDIQYHAEITGLTDKMNEDNPAPPSARALFYGTSAVPYTLMDGGGLSGDWIYDYDEAPLDTLDLYTRVLQDPGFDISISATKSAGSLSVDIEVEALDTIASQEIILYTVVIEKQITDPGYTGTNGDTVFQNVVREMLPNAAGLSFIQAWNPGDKQTASFDWTIENVVDQEMVYVVVFLQNAVSKNVYQAASNDPDLGATSVQEIMKARDMSMMVYPNPATDRAYVMFADIPGSSKVELQLFNHLGSLVRNEIMEPGLEIHEFDLSGLNRGVYFIRAIQNGRIIEVSKLMIMK